MASLVVTKDTGELLFDTSKISYGLVKSGSMSLLDNWGRYYLKSAQLDPNNGANWTQAASGDPIHGFTVSSAQSPIVFIVGSGCLVGTIRSGSSITFLYCNAGIATKFYCFDLMADNIAGSPFLKTYRDDGVITFNSLQPPLNVVAAIAAPAPPVANDAYGRKLLTYDGGRAQKRRWQAGTTESAMDCIVDITLGTGIEYAVFLPWARSAGIIETNPYQSSSGPVTQYSVSEGAYGRIGGISFMFGAAGGTTEAFPGGSTWSIPVSYTSIPVDRFPVALVIGTAGLPFPYN